MVLATIQQGEFRKRFEMILGHVGATQLTARHENAFRGSEAAFENAI